LTIIHRLMIQHHHSTTTNTNTVVVEEVVVRENTHSRSLTSNLLSTTTTTKTSTSSWKWLTHTVSKHNRFLCPRYVYAGHSGSACWYAANLTSFVDAVSTLFYSILLHRTILSPVTYTMILSFARITDFCTFVIWHFDTFFIFVRILTHFE